MIRRRADPVDWLMLAGVVVVLLLALLTSGCAASPVDVAIRSSNGLGAVLDRSAPVIKEHCTDRYRKLADVAAVENWDATKREAAALQVDKVCLPLGVAYDSARAVHIAAVAAVLGVQAGGSMSPAELLAIGGKAVSAGQTLARSIQALLSKEEGPR